MNLGKFVRKLLYHLFYFNLIKVKKYKNIHSGGKIYLLGDSAEIKFYDLKFFDDSPMICFNVSYMHKDLEIRENPLYGMTVEPFYFLKTMKYKQIKQSYKMAQYTFHYLKSRNIPFFVSLTNFISIFDKVFVNLFYKLPLDKFTGELIRNKLKFNKGAFHAAVSLALYMGCKEIVVLGVSYHSYSVQNRWYHKGLGKIKNENDWPLNTDDNFLIFNLAKQFADFKIITPYQFQTSMFFDAISYKDYTSAEINYRENFEIASIEFLDACRKENHYGFAKI